MTSTLESNNLSAAKRFYRPELDALRFFAFLVVFWFHRMDYVPVDPVTQPWAYAIGMAGAFGVPVFFFFCSFLILEFFLGWGGQTRNRPIKSFYVARIFRIF